MKKRAADMEPHTEHHHMLPQMVVIGHLEATEAKTARSYARGLIERQCAAPEASAFRVRAYAGGAYYELQESGERASVLEEVLEQLEQTGKAFVALAGGRCAEVYRDADDLYTIIHESRPDSEDQAPLLEPPVDGPQLEPFYGRGRPYLYAGLTALGAGALVLTISAGSAVVMTMSAEPEPIHEPLFPTPSQALAAKRQELGVGEYIQAMKYEPEQGYSFSVKEGR